MRASEICQKASAPAIATDREMRIVQINRAARELLGYDRRDAVGRRIQELIKLRDSEGNGVKPEPYEVSDLLGQIESAKSLTLEAIRPSGDSLPVSASVVVVKQPAKKDYELVIQLRPKRRRRKGDVVIDRILATPRDAKDNPEELRGAEAKRRSLTPRQIEVLRLLATGSRPEQMATLLGISPATVRAHIQQVLKRLEVRNRLEAVAVGFRERLI